MEALDLYNKSLTYLRSGVASLRTTLGDSLTTMALNELKGKMERCVCSVGGVCVWCVWV